MAFTSVKLKPESGANRLRSELYAGIIETRSAGMRSRGAGRIKSADDAYSFVATCGFPIETSRTGRWLGRPSTMPARQTIVRFGPGELFGQRRPLKAGLWSSDLGAPGLWVLPGPR
jgi:hypothetical protein